MNEHRWGVIFDFDGVIVDTEASHEICWRRVAKRLHKPLLREDFLRGFGLKNERFIKEIICWTDKPSEIAAIIDEKERYFQELVKKQSIPLVAGLKPFLKQLAARQIPVVIGSSSILKNIELVLESTQLSHHFPFIVSGEDVTKGKPNPEVFLRCAEKISIRPESCVVFEDAMAGIEAAKRANMHACALTTTFSKEKFLDQMYLPDAIYKDFTDIDLHIFENWF